MFYPPVGNIASIARINDIAKGANMGKVSSTKTIQAMGKIASSRYEVQSLIELLEAVPLWRPASALQKECREVLDLIDNQERRFDRKLCVVVIGPGGAGKSTLVNALAGRDDLTSVGIRRPTTQHVVLVCQSSGDTDYITSEFDSPAVEVVVEPAALHSGHYILVDTPDIDSTHQNSHQKIVSDIIDMADVLICMFNAENPKTRDHVDFFRKYVQRFDGESLIGVLNKCDRLDERELKGHIITEFQDYITKAWKRPLRSLFCISARRHLNRPNWDHNAEPKHEFDQYQALEKILMDVSNLTNGTLERRLKNIQEMVRFVSLEVQKAVQEQRQHMEAAWSHITTMQKHGQKSALDVIKKYSTGQTMGVNVKLYQKIAQQWFGPVGWLIALWTRILIFGTGMMALFRFGNPIRQIMGILSSIRHLKDSKASVETLNNGDMLEAAARQYRMAYLSAWPEIAERLVQGGWSPAVRVVDTQVKSGSVLGEGLLYQWQETLEWTIETASRRFSSMWLQLLLNIPSIALLAHIAWLTAKHYFAADYLSTDFFIHAFITAGIIMFLSFFLFQAALGLCYRPRRIMALSLEQVHLHLDSDQIVPVGPISEQLQRLLVFSNSQTKK